MNRAIASLCVVAALCLLPSAYCAACPLVAVPQVAAVASVGVQSVAVACPQVAVQSFAVAASQVQVQSFAVQPVAVQTFAVQQQAVAVLAAPVCIQAAGGQGVRAQRQGILSRILGDRRLLPKAKSVSVVR